MCVFELRQDYTTRGNTKNIDQTRARLDLREFSFSYRVVSDWNVLPEWVFSARNIVTKHELSPHASKTQQTISVEAVTLEPQDTPLPLDIFQGIYCKVMMMWNLLISYKNILLA